MTESFDRAAIDREALAKEIHERFAPEHAEHWDDLDDDEKRDSDAWDYADAIIAYLRQGQPSTPNIAEVIRPHVGNGRGWCGACKRLVGDQANHIAEQIARRNVT